MKNMRNDADRDVYDESASAMAGSRPFEARADCYGGAPTIMGTSAAFGHPSIKKT